MSSRPETSMRRTQFSRSHPKHSRFPFARGHLGRKKKANPKNMKKTSRRGAYAKGRKKQMSIRRAPLVETYKYQSTPGTNESFRLDRTSAYNQVLNQAFVAAFTQKLDIPNDGLSTTADYGPSCRGRDIYSKLTATKLRFDFPEDQWSIRDNYTPPTVYWGWVKKNMFKTSDTTPTPAQVNQGHFNALINEQMENQFDEANDKLDFRDRRGTQYKIIGKKRVIPSRDKSIAIPLLHVGDHQSGGPATGDPFADTAGMRGALPPVFVTCKWEVNRKIELQESKSWLGGTGTDDSRFYPANTWVPFIVIFNPSFGKQIEDTTNQNGQILVSYNSVHYYTDS
jgi:hypothetical protein